MLADDNWALPSDTECSYYLDGVDSARCLDPHIERALLHDVEDVTLVT